MPSLHNLNSPPHPFWDFIASLDDAVRNQSPNHAENQQGPSGTAGESSKKKPADKQPTVEDEVAAEASTQDKGKAPEAAPTSGQDQQMPFRGRGRCGFNETTRRGHHGDRSGACHGRRGRGVLHEHQHQHHPPGEGFDGFGDFNPFGMRGPPFGGFGLFGPQGAPHRGPPPPGPHGPQHGPQFHHHHHERGPRGAPNNFNLGEFLSNLGSRLGLDLSGAAEGLGLDHFPGNSTSHAEGVDFEPRADLFDTPAAYMIHLSLPGAKKEDLGVDWDGENSTLRIGGVVHRPGVDEETLKLLAVDGRKREVGVFEKKIHLGTKRDPAKVDIAAITARMTDGVLIVKVPKVEVEYKKWEVPISSSTSPSPVRQEKQQQPAIVEAPSTAETLPEKRREADTDMDVDDARSETEKGDDMEYEDPAEQLPEYKEPGQDDAGDSEEDEGEYVKIDVK
jgi:HSP20 family protein